MRLLVLGLGNPGVQYGRTRHNAGFLVIDEICARINCELSVKRLRRYALGHWKSGTDILHLAKPLTYMNNSGQVLGYMFRETGVDTDSLLVVCDNMDLPQGTCRLKKGGGDAGHNGLKSIIGILGNGDFLRLYIGIGRPEYSGQTVSHVLGVMEDGEWERVREAVDTAASGVLRIPDSGIQAVMNEINKKNRP